MSTPNPRVQKMLDTSLQEAAKLSAGLIDKATELCVGHGDDVRGCILAVAAGQIKAAVMILENMADKRYAADVLRLEADMLSREWLVYGPKKPPERSH